MKKNKSLGIIPPSNQPGENQTNRNRGPITMSQNKTFTQTEI